MSATAKPAAERLAALEAAADEAAAEVTAAEADLQVKRDALVMLRVAKAEGAQIDAKLAAARERAVTGAESRLRNAEATLAAITMKLADERERSTFEDRRAHALACCKHRDDIARIVRRMLERADEQAADAAELRRLVNEANIAAAAAFGKNDPATRILSPVPGIAAYSVATLAGDKRAGSGQSVKDLRAMLSGPWRPNRGPLAGRLSDLGV